MQTPFNYIIVKTNKNLTSRQLSICHEKIDGNFKIRDFKKAKLPTLIKSTNDGFEIIVDNHIFSCVPNILAIIRGNCKEWIKQDIQQD